MLILSITQYFCRVYTVYNNQYNTQYFPEVHTAFTKQYAEFSGGEYCLYSALRSISGSSILLKVSNTQYYQGVDTANTK